jgi:photosystem II stability/assembly factor-like uncharacterized protein
MKLVAALLLSLCSAASAQFEILDGHTTASLRGIDALSSQAAWASGSGGTVLLTVDGGKNWKHCAVPPGGDNLDFRGIQAYGAYEAVVMASGKGPLSAIYKTTDGCDSWKLVFANPDADGFFDALQKVGGFGQMYLMGDPVGGRFRVFRSMNRGASWQAVTEPGLEAAKGAGGFAASNSGLIEMEYAVMFATSATGTEPPQIYRMGVDCRITPDTCGHWTAIPVPMRAAGASSGIFSLGPAGGSTLVAVGGNYANPTESAGTAAVSHDAGRTWRVPATLPSGYRSGVAYDPQSDIWLAVGTSGADISKDDANHWTPLRDAGTGWNAVSLPFVVGEKGKIGKLKPLPPAR